MGTISVIIPTFNRERTIGYCLESVFRQTLQPLEIIVVDDCSTDNTVRTVHQFNNPLVKVIQLEKNSGAQAARNQGIREAKGEWIAFLDSDDEWLPLKLEKQINYALHHSFDICYCGCYIQNNAQNAQKEEYKTPDYERNSYLKLLNYPGPMFPGMLVRKNLLVKIGYLDEEVPAYQEWDTSIRLARLTGFGFLNEPLFIYHLLDTTAISKNVKWDAAGYAYIVEKHKDEIISKVGMESYSDHLKLICKKYYSTREFAKLRTYNNKLLNISSLPLISKWLHKITILFSPDFYYQFRESISLSFILKRIKFILFKKLNL